LHRLQRAQAADQAAGAELQRLYNFVNDMLESRRDQARGESLYAFLTLPDAAAWGALGPPSKLARAREGSGGPLVAVVARGGRALNARLMPTPHDELRAVYMLRRLIRRYGLCSAYPAEAYDAAQAAWLRSTSRERQSCERSTTREEYCRRRLLTDATLHPLMSAGTGGNCVKAAWVVFFDSMCERLPLRPRKNPCPAMRDVFSRFLKENEMKKLSWVARVTRVVDDPRTPALIAAARHGGGFKQLRLRQRQMATRFQERQAAAVQDLMPRTVYSCPVPAKSTFSTMVHTVYRDAARRQEVSGRTLYEEVVRASEGYRDRVTRRRLNQLLRRAGDSSDSGRDDPVVKAAMEGIVQAEAEALKAEGMLLATGFGRSSRRHKASV
jgi:hypothetical protein